MVLKRVGALSLAKVMGSIYAMLGIIVGAIFAVMSFIGAAVGASSGEPESLVGIFFGVGAIIALPILYGVLAFVMSLLMATLFNALARVVGGIEVELAER